MEYQVLARKWRPAKFIDMIGQEHITKTIQNALSKNKLAHAYLFVGPRGIGKTTIARILAKAMNCKKAPVSEPCDECASCLSINAGSNIDIIEIDGASNNGVDNVRNLREEALYAPATSKYKVYIIDEVHMLSSSAWNALLKILEEPPAHVKFIFATTEVHKIPVTVISRCQRYDLRKIPLNMIIRQLEKITASEGVKITKEAVRVIAQSADGGMRDALSLTDQMIAFHSSEESEEIDEVEILSIFGIVSSAQKETILKAILTNDYSTLVYEINKLAQQGKNLEQLFYDIVDYLRGIEITFLLNDPDEILEVGPDIIEIFRRLTQYTALEKVQMLLESLSTAGRLIHDAVNKHVTIETALIKAMRYSSSVKLNDIIKRLNQIKNSPSLSSLNISSSSEAPSNYDTQPRPVQTIKPPAPPPVNQEPPAPVAPQAADKTKSKKEEDTPRMEEAPRNAEKKEEPAKERVISPEKLWHKLIEAVGAMHADKSQLKFWMVEGKPVSFDKNRLKVEFDEEYNNLHYQKISDEKVFLIKNLQYLTGIEDIQLDLVKVKGLISPSKTQPIKEMRDIREKIQSNDFVKKTITAFNGFMVDFRG